MKIPTLLFSHAAGLSAASIGIFEEAANVGKIDFNGSSGFSTDKRQHRITGRGNDIWFAGDAFQFLRRKSPATIKLERDGDVFAMSPHPRPST
jgi:hypothetical protein